MGKSLSSAKFQELKEILDLKVDEYNQKSFIEKDPISIPHQVKGKQNIESIGLIIATISWGNRAAILKSGQKLLNIMGYEPYWYIQNASKKELNELAFVHRTFNHDDLRAFILSMRRIYKKHNSLEELFISKANHSTKDKISHFRNQFIGSEMTLRSHKHISNPQTNSACKRINMYLRWMVRNDKRQVDFGIWNSISMRDLYIPLDVHSGRIARELGLLERKQNDWKALEELMTSLRKLDSTDPVRYDYALFGIGVNEKRVI